MSGEARYRDGFFTVEDGFRLHFRDYFGSNDRLPLLCLHGLTRNLKDFEDFAELFAPERRVVLLDFRGRGKSDYDPQPERYTPLHYSGDVLRLMDHLGFAEAIFVGTSLGGLVTMIIAEFEPDRIAATILNDVGPELRDVGLDRIKTYVGKGARFGSWEEAGAAIAVNNANLPARYTDDDWTRMARKICREDKGEIIFDYDQSIAVPFNTQGAAPNADLWPLFAKLTERPVLVVRGEKSDLLEADVLDKMTRVSPNVTSVTVPGVGHAPDLTESESVAAIRAFLDRVVP